MPRYMFTEKQPCGTYAAYRRHLYYGEPVCLPCRKANARRATEEYRAKAKPTARRRRRAAAGQPTGWEPGFAVDVLALLDVCEAIEPGWDREAAMGDTF